MMNGRLESIVDEIGEAVKEELLGEYDWTEVDNYLAGFGLKDEIWGIIDHLQDEVEANVDEEVVA